MAEASPEDNQNKINADEPDVDNLVQQQCDEKIELEKAKANNEELRNRNDELTKEKDELKKENDELKKGIDKLKKESDELKKELADTRELLSHTITKLTLEREERQATEAKSQEGMLKGKSSMMESTQSYLQFLLARKPWKIMSASKQQPAITVPVYSESKSLPNIIEVLNSEASSSNPQICFALQQPEQSYPSEKKLAIVLALCSTVRIYQGDRDLVHRLRSDGFHNVILIVLRSTSNEEKFKEAIDIDIESGVGQERKIIHILHFHGQVLESMVNSKNIKLLLALAVKPFN